MKLVDCLAELSRQNQLALARLVQLASLPTGAAAAPALAARLTDPRHLENVVAALPPEARAALKVVLYHGGGQGITVELGKHLVNQIAGRRRQSDPAALQQLQDLGLVGVRSVEYRQRFCVPAELLDPLVSLMGRRLVGAVCVPRAASVRPQPSTRDLLEDQHRFLAYVFKHDVPLTQQGQIFKRHLRELGQLLSSPRDATDDVGDDATVPFLGRYPEPLGFLVDYGLDRGLLSRSDGRLATTAVLDEWLAESDAVKRRGLFAFWQERHYYPDLQTFLSVVQSLADGWIRLHALVEELAPLVHPSQRTSFSARLQHHLHLFLGPLGCFVLGETATGEQVFCLTPTGRALLTGATPPTQRGQTRFIVQPNFEVIAQRPLDSLVLWQLELIADLVRADTALIYQIDRQTVYRALQTGLSSEAIVGLLQRHTKNALPQNVVFDIQEWSRAFGQVYLMEVCLLRCATPQLAREIRASRRTGRFIRSELTPTDLVVAKEDYATLIAALVADGHLPRPGIADGAAAAQPSGSAAFGGQGSRPPIPNQMRASGLTPKKQKGR